MDFLDDVLAATVGPKLSPAEKEVKPILFDENIQVLSTFELHQVASLTYNVVAVDGIFELIAPILRTPIDHTPLTVQKSLVVVRHVLIYGSEPVVNHAYGLLDLIKALMEYNTVLMRQQQGGAMSFFQTLQGGGVDKGAPVREAAEGIVNLLSDTNNLRRIRITSASQDSLVPVGDDGIAFVSDDVRLQILQRKIKEERQVRIQSNLKKSEGGFGAGYASKDGKSVVGASHGIEEMIKMAQIQTQRFSDDDSKPPGHKSQEQIILEELQAEMDATKAVQKNAAIRNNSNSNNNNNNNNNNTAHDLLGFYNNETKTTSVLDDVDLLDFGSLTTNNVYGGTTASTTATTGDLLGENVEKNSAAFVSNDPFSLLKPPTSAQSNNNIPADSGLGLMGTSASSNLAVDPFSAIAPNNATNGTNHRNVGTMNMTPSSGPDRFLALDALSINQDPSPLYNNNNATGISIPSQMVGSYSAFRTNSTNSDVHSFASTMGLPPQPLAVPGLSEQMVAPGSGQVANTYGDTDDTHDPWIMGGATGDGQGLAPAPAAPPPPPPS